jgi:hypothetical protein
MKRTTIFALALAALLAPTAPISFAQEADPKTRLQAAEKMFAERCKKAGEFIYRTAEGVEGVFLMKMRPKGMNHGDQYRMDDPYGSDHGGDAYVKSFLRGKYAASRPKNPTAQTPPRNAYLYVEALDPQDGKRYRYTGKIKEVTKTSSPLIGGDGSTFTIEEFGLDRVPAPSSVARYGVTYDDISTREERDYWIAGSSLKVIDLQTNEVMAERIGYMMDRGQGNKSGGRSPWLLAANNSCPLFSSTHGSTAQINQTEKFVESVLKPVGEK